MTKICISLFFTPLPLSVGTQSLLFFGSDVGPLWSQSLKGNAVSIGCEIRKLWKGRRKYAVGSEVGPLFSWTVPPIGDLRELLSAWDVKLGNFGKG